MQGNENDLARPTSKPASRIKPLPEPPRAWGEALKAELGLTATALLLSDALRRAQRHRLPCDLQPGRRNPGSDSVPGVAGCSRSVGTPGTRALPWPAHIVSAVRTLISVRNYGKHCCVREGTEIKALHASRKLYTVFSHRETTPLLFSASVIYVIVCKKFILPLYFQYRRMSQGRSALWHQILITSANASPHTRVFWDNVLNNEIILWHVWKGLLHISPDLQSKFYLNFY